MKIHGWERYKCNALLGVVNKHLDTKSLLTIPSNVLPLPINRPAHQANFPAHDLIFTEDEGDEFESRLPFRIFSTLIVSLFLYDPFCRNTLEVSYHNLQ